jgi:hypothetical protein
MCQAIFSRCKTRIWLCFVYLPPYRFTCGYFLSLFLLLSPTSYEPYLSRYISLTSISLPVLPLHILLLALSFYINMINQLIHRLCQHYLTLCTFFVCIALNARTFLISLLGSSVFLLTYLHICTLINYLSSPISHWFDLYFVSCSILALLSRALPPYCLSYW